MRITFGISDCGFRISDFRVRAVQSAVRNPKSAIRARRAMTLVELLVTLLILSILGALVLGVAAVAAETARESRTRNMVAHLHTLLMEHMDTYKTRRVKVRDEVTDAINMHGSWSTAQKGRAHAQARLYALRELMLMEVPDRWSDILLTKVPASNASSVSPKFPVYLDVSGSSNGRTPLASIYLRRYLQSAQNANSESEIKLLIDNQGAECLYMIITLATGDGEARTMFHESNIGDTDGDGAPEFLDGWGHPINFLRWAPGFDSEVQLNANDYGIPPASTNLSAWQDAAAGDHDPYDMFRVDPNAFRLLPLIFSGGRDETYSIRLAKPHVTWEGNPNLSSSFPIAGLTNRVPNPYEAVDEDGLPAYLGTDNGDNASTDNIHNHLIGER